MRLSRFVQARREQPRDAGSIRPFLGQGVVRRFPRGSGEKSCRISPVAESGLAGSKEMNGSSNLELFEGESLTAPFGHLEEEVMDILWSCVEANVRDVVEKLERQLAYTTVMTTLDRLYKKGLLARRKESRAFIYSPRMTKGDWERERASGLVAQFLSGPEQGRELLLSTFLDAMGDLDEQLLEELEKKIRAQRRKLLRRSAR